MLGIFFLLGSRSVDRRLLSEAVGLAFSAPISKPVFVFARTELVEARFFSSSKLRLTHTLFFFFWVLCDFVSLLVFCFSALRVCQLNCSVFCLYSFFFNSSFSWCRVSRGNKALPRSLLGSQPYIIYQLRKPNIQFIEHLN